VKSVPKFLTGVLDDLQLEAFSRHLRCSRKICQRHQLSLLKNMDFRAYTSLDRFILLQDVAEVESVELAAIRAPVMNITSTMAHKTSTLQPL